MQNVTNGALLWLAGAIGLATGAGRIPLAALVTLVVLLVLTAVALLKKPERTTELSD